MLSAHALYAKTFSQSFIGRWKILLSPQESKGLFWLSECKYCLYANSIAIICHNNTEVFEDLNIFQLQFCRKSGFYELCFVSCIILHLTRLHFQNDQHPSEVSVCILDFTVANTVIGQECYSDSMSAEMSLMYKAQNKGLRRPPCGTPDTTLAQSDLTQFTTGFCCLRHRKALIHLFFITYSIAKQFAHRGFRPCKIRTYLLSNEYKQ